MRYSRMSSSNVELDEFRRVANIDKDIGSYLEKRPKKKSD